MGKTNADGTTTGAPTLGPYWQYIPNNTAVVAPTKQNLVKVMTANPTANDAVFGWIYNKANGIFYSAADYTK